MQKDEYFIYKNKLKEYNGEPVLDLNYIEDSNADVDMNVVMTESGKLVEVQGTAEKTPFSRQQFTELLDLAEHGLKQIFQIQRKLIEGEIEPPQKPKTPTALNTLGDAFGSIKI